ncbi:hypothetical protein FH972_023361 [Carpinus fangiana]|uniref:HTH APSES-type domain-containing protein n=1 Tax=Carpinus fangiana TaxID=176857 RepID=A0A5N6KVD0_9ROSI|nr:hypothetical protein FH972_023361 [Carpinus fangiana]
MPVPGIYSATYSNVPVYEFNVEGNHVMRRRIDNWINATHILKVADFDKPARTRILEREVQKGVHEKVQGGYGKYQGTWIPLEDGRALAERNNCLDKLRPIFDFVPGDRSPPPAPKHATAAAGKPKPRQSVQQRRVPGTKRRGPTQQTAALTHAVNHRSQASEVSFDTYSQQPDDAIPDDMTMVSHSQFSDDEYDRASQFGTAGSRKRKRGVQEPPPLSMAEQQQQLWADELLDYFVLQGSGEQHTRRPEIPDYIDLNRPLDNKGYTPLHWAAAMGDVDLMDELVHRGARIDAQGTVEGETPLMRACAFTNNWDKRSMGRVIELLHPTIAQLDHYGSSVFHHIATSTCSKSRYAVARYYLDTILDVVVNVGYDKSQITRLLDMQDTNGDTAVLIAARQGARKCVRRLVEQNVSLDIPNSRGESAEQIIQDLNARRKQRYSALPGSSSPVIPPSSLTASASQLFSDPTERFGNPNKRPKYTSDAASLIASQLPTLINSRTEQLATALEAELTERDREAQESERLLEQRKAEVDELRRRNAEIEEEDQSANGDEAQQRELESLISESSSLLRVERAAELRNLIEANEAQADPSADGTPVEKLVVARLLGEAQGQREDTLQQVIEAQALAGHGERQDIYRRLIGSATNIKPEEVDDMLSEIVEELEAAKTSGTATAVHGSNGGIVREEDSGLGFGMGPQGAKAQGMGQPGGGVAPVRMSLAPQAGMGRQPVYAAGGVGKPVHVMG